MIGIADTQAGSSFAGQVEVRDVEIEALSKSGWRGHGISAQGLTNFRLWSDMKNVALWPKTYQI